MKAIKVSKTVEFFFKYAFEGDGKYYLTERGSRHYRNTCFGAFFKLNRNCIDIVERGNDAPRKGRTGEYVIVKFNDKFFEKYTPYMQYLEYVKEKIKKEAELKQKRIDEIGNQHELLRAEFKKDPEFLSKIKNRIENYSSKKWRNWVKMKVCQRITNESFELLTLSAAEIRDIVYEF